MYVPVCEAWCEAADVKKLRSSDAAEGSFCRTTQAYTAPTLKVELLGLSLLDWAVIAARALSRETSRNRERLSSERAAAENISSSDNFLDRRPAA